jgi:hypothetical protein
MACEGVIEVAGLAGVLSREPRINYQLHACNDYIMWANLHRPPTKLKC